MPNKFTLKKLTHDGITIEKAKTAYARNIN